MKQFLKNIFPAVYGLINYFTIRLLQDTGSGYLFWQRPLWLNVLEIGSSVAVGYLILIAVNKICRYNDTHKTPGSNATTSLGFELLSIAVLALCVANGILVPMAALTDDGLSANDFVTLNTVLLLYTLVYYGCIRILTYLRAYIRHQLLLEKVSNDQLKTELKFLKAQYHPHFLFNALNTIYFQVDEDVPGAKKSIELLSELLRYQLYDGQQLVTIGQELNYLKNYLRLQKIRASEKLNLTVHFEEDLESQQVYPLLFLPLVENAFKYVGGKFSICITAKSTADGMFFSVKNDLPSPTPAGSRLNKGIGIENLNRRLELLYNDKHKLSLKRSEDYFMAELELKY